MLLSWMRNDLKQGHSHHIDGCGHSKFIGIAEFLGLKNCCEIYDWET